MNAEVVFTEDFRADLQRQTRRLVTEERRDWAERLIEEIEMVAKLLSGFPGAGARETRRSGREIRRLVMRRLPFVVWYYYQARSRKIVVLRLFHVRQRRQERSLVEKLLGPRPSRGPLTRNCPEPAKATLAPFPAKTSPFICQVLFQ